MPRPIHESELDDILAAVARFPEGTGIEGVESALAAKLPRRTLQRRLAMLVADGRLSVAGQRRGARYFRGRVVEENIAEQVGVREALKLEPLIRMDASPPDEMNSCYFFNRYEGVSARFVTYHFSTISEVNQSVEKLSASVAPFFTGQFPA